MAIEDTLTQLLDELGVVRSEPQEGMRRIQSIHIDEDGRLVIGHEVPNEDVITETAACSDSVSDYVDSGGDYDTIYATSASLADVEAAIALAESGDRVEVPAGSATWDDQLVITKGIWLCGAGVGNTVITSNYDATNPSSILDTGNYFAFHNPLSPELNEPFRISGFTLDLNNKCWGILISNPTITAINKIRIDHNRIENTNLGLPQFGLIALIWGTAYGVMDNNEFDTGYIKCSGLDETTWNNVFETSICSINSANQSGSTLSG